MVKTQGVRLRWAQKILRAKNFVVLTDKESIIALRGVDPHSLHDVISLQEQAASLDNFMFRLKELKRQHEIAIESIMEARHAKRNKAKVSSSRSKKISVKEV